MALDGIDLDIAPGEFVCLLGPSGCGKSTLLNAVAGFSPPTSGEHRGRRQAGDRRPGPDRGMVFQEYALFPWMTVAQNIAFGLEIQSRREGARSAPTSTRCSRCCTSRTSATAYPKDLSGGMRQRVAIARVLALDSPIMLMDEPFGALDALTRRNLQDELLRIWIEIEKTILFVTHGIEESDLPRRPHRGDDLPAGHDEENRGARLCRVRAIPARRSSPGRCASSPRWSARSSCVTSATKRPPTAEKKGAARAPAFANFKSFR